MTTEQPHPYEFLTAENIPDYLSAHPELAARVDAGAIELIEEIGDGNLNVVFRVRDAAGASIILKQALPYVRMTGEGWPMTPERARHEAESLQAHHAAAADLVVDVVLPGAVRRVDTDRQTVLGWGLAVLGVEVPPPAHRLGTVHQHAEPPALLAVEVLHPEPAPIPGRPSKVDSRQGKSRGGQHLGDHSVALRHCCGSQAARLNTPVKGRVM